MRLAWEDILKVSVTDDANFFALGGNSLAAVAISARIEQTCQVPPRLRTLFDNPRFADYAYQIFLVAAGQSHE